MMAQKPLLHSCYQLSHCGLLLCLNDFVFKEGNESQNWMRETVPHVPAAKICDSHLRFFFLDQPPPRYISLSLRGCLCFTHHNTVHSSVLNQSSRQGPQHPGSVSKSNEQLGRTMSVEAPQHCRGGWLPCNKLSLLPNLTILKYTWVWTLISS